MKTITFFLAILSISSTLWAQCPTPNSTPSLQVSAYDGTNVTLSFATTNPNVFTNYAILVTNKNGILLGARNELSFNLSSIPSTNGYGFYCLTYNQADLNAAVPQILGPLSLVCPGVSLQPVNGNYLITDLLGNIQTNCPSLLGAGDIPSLTSLLCTLPDALDVALPFGVTNETVTQIAKLNAPVASLHQNNGSVTINFANSTTQARVLQVLNNVGGVIQHDILQNNTQLYEIDTQNFPNGLYFVQINEGKQTQILKFLK